MKVKETVDTIGFGVAVTALTVGAAVVGVVQAAAAGVEFLVLAPFAHSGKTIRVTRPTIVAQPSKERIEVRIPQAA